MGSHSSVASRAQLQMARRSTDVEDWPRAGGGPNRRYTATGGDGNIDGQRFTPEFLFVHRSISELQLENREKDALVADLRAQLQELRRIVTEREQELAKMRREVNKLKSVLDASELDEDVNMPCHIKKTPSIIGKNNIRKKQGVSGESGSSRVGNGSKTIEKYDKDSSSQQLITKAILENDFLKHLDATQVREIVACMFPRTFEGGTFVIRQGDPGSHLYVTADGELQVIQDNVVLGRMGPGKVFGELAVLYNCKRTAAIYAVTNAQLWVLDRRIFQTIMMQTGLQRHEENAGFLKSVPLFADLEDDVVAKLADVLEMDYYPPNDFIIRQDTTGDTFFIIINGQVRVTKKIPGQLEEEEIRILGAGEYFGEQALLKEDKRTANVISMANGVECLALDRDSFNQLIGDLQEIKSKIYKEDEEFVLRPSESCGCCRDEDGPQLGDVTLDQLNTICTLGVGGFGRVELVHRIDDHSKTYALKILKKSHMVETHQQNHILSEKDILTSCNSSFIVRLFKSFKDSKYLYLLMEVCLGGETWTLLRDRGVFDDPTSRFYTGCVIEALEYLHHKGIIYRDLKPENVMLETTGYAKLVDFGFSKHIGNSKKTWTFCGTPEYVAPEVILNKGHDKAVDFWAIGILMFEFLTGDPPFRASDPMKTYNVILKGIDMVEFPRHVTRHAQLLIKRLCRDIPTERLGYQKNGIEQLKRHKWFQGFDWNGLRQRTLLPPKIPQVQSVTDTCNFDEYPPDDEVPPDDNSGWDVDF